MEKAAAGLAGARQAGPWARRRVYAAYQSTFFTEIDFQTWFQPASLP